MDERFYALVVLFQKQNKKTASCMRNGVGVGHWNRALTT